MADFLEQDAHCLKINMTDLTSYLFLQHDYDNINCATLITTLYKQEFDIDIKLPEYPKSISWMRKFTTKAIDSWALNNAKKVSLTNSINFDLIVMKSLKSDQLTHFGLYIKPNKMLHVEEGKSSRIDILSDDWIKQIYGIYRHNDLVQ